MENSFTLQVQEHIEKNQITSLDDLSFKDMDKLTFLYIKEYMKESEVKELLSDFLHAANTNDLDILFDIRDDIRDQINKMIMQEHGKYIAWSSCPVQDDMEEYLDNRSRARDANIEFNNAYASALYGDLI